ncbi:MAG TPA: hypothetical protein VJH20_02495 [Candidatus Nanoarchaeia archaeon]|nr:hypothetical protein [Candidatus Nanoarchaeia archaeon]
MKKAPILLIIFLVVISACNSTPKQNYDKLANCLAEKNVKEYGAFWCPNCAQQKKMFGNSYQILEDKQVYIECDPRCVKNKDGKLPMACNGIEGQPQLCLDKKVEKYPDWEFSDGSRLVGVQELSVLADKAGCEI